MRVGVVIFPGSNCDRDMIHVLRDVMQVEVQEIWHKSTSLDAFKPLDLIVLPGGFSYGDYLRTGAIARFSPIMKDVVSFAKSGGMVLGICNGFQILCEAHLLPGVLLRNTNELFSCKNSFIKVETTNAALTQQTEKDQILKIPVAHAEGRFYAPNNALKDIEDKDQVLFRYCDENGELTDEANFNGSVHHIAGICNEKRNIFGMMPHPERASEEALGNTDGRILFESLLALTNA